MMSYTLLILCLTHLRLTTLAYADPGSGILIWQLATASALGLLFYAKAIVSKIRVLIKSRESKENHQSSTPNS